MSDLRTCDFCDSGVEVEFADFSPPKDRTAYLCIVCRSTHAGNAYVFPEQYQGKDVIRVVAECTNLILGAIKQRES